MSDSAGRRWPRGIAIVLMLTVAANAGIYWAANDPGAAAVEPDYYRKAVEWDSTLAQASRNARLAWTADASLGPRARDGARTISITLRDAAGNPLAGATVDLTAIHNRVPRSPWHAVSITDALGSSRIEMPLAPDGLWELRLVVTRAADRYTATLRRDTDSSGPVR